MKRRIVFILTAISLSLALSSCLNHISDRQINKILDAYGYSSDTGEPVDVVEVIDLKPGTKGLSENDDNKLVLVHDVGYGIAIVNTITDELTIPEFWFTPLNIVQTEIWNDDEDTNIEDLNIIADYYEKYGIDCFEEQTYAEEYLREISGSSGIIPTDEARDAISGSAARMFPDISSSDDIKIIFEDGSAVPMYYTTYSPTMVYNWSGVLDESVYNVWKASTDSQTQEIMAGLYGPPYVMKSVCAVVDKNLNEVGTFDSFEEAERYLEQYTDQEQNNDRTAATAAPSNTAQPTPEQKTASTETPVRQPDDLYRSDLTYKRMEYDIHNSIMTNYSTYEEISKVIEDFNNKCESYMNTGSTEIMQYLRSGTTAYNQQTQYKKNHPNLTQYYESTYVRTTRASENYYYAWVREQMQQTENGTTKTVENNWVYKLSKDGDRWYIEDYTADPLSK